MANEDGKEYNITEIFAIKFVLADVVIIAALILAGPWIAVAITALFVLSFVLVWYLVQTEPFADSSAGSSAGTEPAAETHRTTPDGSDGNESVTGPDPVTKLQTRYAAGELTDAEFEAKLERLIEANEHAERAGIETEDLELEFERSE